MQMQVQIPLRWFHNRSPTVQQRHRLWTTTREIMRNPISEFLIHNVRQKYTSGKKSAKSETPYDQASQQIFPGQKRQIFCNKKGSSPNPKGRQNFAIGIIITFLIIPPPTHHRNWHHHPHQGEVKYNWDRNIRRSMPSTSRNSATLRSGMVVPCSPMGDRVLRLFVPATHPSVLKYAVPNTNTNTIPTHPYWTMLSMQVQIQTLTYTVQIVHPSVL